MQGITDELPTFAEIIEVPSAFELAKSSAFIKSSNKSACGFLNLNR